MKKGGQQGMWTFGLLWLAVYPDASGIIALSRVGFDENGERDLAEFGY
jgi:hypothetical protein